MGVSIKENFLRFLFGGSGVFIEVNSGGGGGGSEISGVRFIWPSAFRREDF